MEKDIKWAARIILDASHGAAVLVSDYVEATDIVLDAMRNEITMQQALKWCIDKGYTKKEA